MRCCANSVSSDRAASFPICDLRWHSLVDGQRVLAGFLKVLDQFSKSGDTSATVLGSSDSVYESRLYNWHAGSWKDGYTYAASYRLKPDAPSNTVETLSKALIVPRWRTAALDEAIKRNPLGGVRLGLWWISRRITMRKVLRLLLINRSPVSIEKGRIPADSK